MPSRISSTCATAGRARSTCTRAPCAPSSNGWEPQADFADSLGLERDSRGYLRTDFATAQTSLPDVYAIGEVADRMHPCVVTSLADGVTAAKAIQRRWERPAPPR